MIPLESPVPEIGPPGSESGGRKRTHGTRPAARLRKRRISHRPPTGYAPLLDSTQLWGQGISTAGRGGPRPRAAGIVGQLPRVRGRTPGLPPRGVRPRLAASAQRGSFRSTCGTSLRKARLELETRNSRGRTARLPRRSGHDRAGSLKSGVSRLPGTAPAMRPPDRLGGRAARGPLPSGTPSTRIRGAGRRTRGPRIRPGGVAPPPGGP